MSEKPKKRANKKRAGKDGQAAEPVASAKPEKKKPAAKKSALKEAAKKAAAKKAAVKKAAAKKAAAKKLAAEKVAAKKAGAETKRTKPEHESTTKSDEAAVAGADPFEVAKQTVKGSVPAIVATMVRKAKEGSCPHAKTLLEMTGARHMFDGEAEGQANGEPWAKLVLERLDEAESDGEQEAALAERS